MQLSWFTEIMPRTTQKNKVAIIADTVITSACFLYILSHFTLGIKTNHRNSYKTAFLWLSITALSDSSLVVQDLQWMSHLCSASESSWSLLITSKFILLPPGAGSQWLCLHVRSLCVTGSCGFHRCPFEGDRASHLGHLAAARVRVLFCTLIQAAG